MSSLDGSLKVKLTHLCKPAADNEPTSLGAGEVGVVGGAARATEPAAEARTVGVRDEADDTTVPRATRRWPPASSRCASGAQGAYTVQRVVGGLNQPIYMTQAPGDNTSIYIVERADAGSQLGKIRKYDLQTQALHDISRSQRHGHRRTAACCR